MKPEPMQHANALPNSQSPLVKWLDQYGNGATIVACVVMIGGAIWYSYTRTSSSRSEAAWAQYSQARSAEDFGNIADVYSNTEVGTWARLGEGERLVDSGISLMFTDREAALGELKKADEAFRKVLGIKSATDTARERAAWGLAKSTEAQSDSDTTKAIEGYTALLNQFPKSIYKAAAEERIESLKSPDAKEFYAWFHKQHPKPPDPKKPKDGLPDGHPSLESLLDEKSDGEKSKSEEQTKTVDLVGSVVAKLKSEIEIEFTKVPLQDALKLIAEKCEVEIELDGEALKASGYTKNMEQNFSLGKVTGLEAIEAILKKYEKQRGRPAMVLVIQEDQKKALFTTVEFAEKGELKPFDFSKPAEPPKTDQSPDDKPEESKPDAKKDAKKDAKDSETEKAPEDKPKKGEKPADEPSKETKSDSTPKMILIAEKLQKKTDVSFNDQPFEDLFTFLGKFHDVPFQIDADALQAAGIKKNAGVTLTLTGVSVLEAIGEIFRQIERAKPTDSLVLVIDEAEKRARITTSTTAKKDKLVPVKLPKKTEKPKGEDKDAPAESK